MPWLVGRSMTLKTMSTPKFYSAINYDFRPDFYWLPARSPLEAALRNVKGRNRREMIRDYHSDGLLPALSDNLLRDTLDEDTRLLTKPILTAAAIWKCLKISRVLSRTFIRSSDSTTAELSMSGTRHASRTCGRRVTQIEPVFLPFIIRISAATLTDTKLKDRPEDDGSSLCSLQRLPTRFMTSKNPWEQATYRGQFETAWKPSNQPQPGFEIPEEEDRIRH
jgi:hypothetical protein